MKCTNCGAGMDLVRDRAYFRCPYCLTFAFPEGANVLQDDGIVKLGSPSKLACPVCAARLELATLEEHPVLHCSACRGVLLSCPALADVVAIRRSGGKRARAARIDPKDLERVVHCPTCRGRMDTAPYLGPGNVVIDTCGECTIVWLDHGELAVIERHPG